MPNDKKIGFTKLRIDWLDSEKLTFILDRFHRRTDFSSWSPDLFEHMDDIRNDYMLILRGLRVIDILSLCD